MDKAPLVMDEIAAGEAFVRRLNEFRPMKAACWLRSAEGGERYLYVVLDGLTVENTDDAYREVDRIARAMTDHYINPFRVKLIRPEDPIARALMDLYRRFPRIPRRFEGTVLGGIPVAEAYIYPPPTTP